MGTGERRLSRRRSISDGGTRRRSLAAWLVTGACALVVTTLSALAGAPAAPAAPGARSVSSARPVSRARSASSARPVSSARSVSAASAHGRPGALAEHGQCPAATSAQANNASPGAPTRAHAIAGNGSVTVTWCPPRKGQAHVTGFTVKSSAGQTFTASVPNDYVIASATNGTPVSYTV